MLKYYLILIVFYLSTVLSIIHGQSINYKWDHLKIGGGGYVTGMVIHPKDKNIQYFRTDIGGAYRWNVKEAQWEQLLNQLDNRNLMGVDGISLDPNMPNRVYLALGRWITEEGGVYRSEDTGKTWTKLFSAHFDANSSAGRWIGECLAIDPNCSDVIYVGTRKEGLFRSFDDGKTWLKANDVPNGFIGVNPIGIRSIVFDPVDKTNNRSSIIYIGIPGTGIYFSKNGGDSFSLLHGSPKDPARLQVVNHELFVTHSTGLAVMSMGKWYNLTPAEGKSYVGIAVDEINNNKIIVAQHDPSFNNSIFRSDNKGKTWQQINTSEFPAHQNKTVPWWPDNWFSSATSSLTLAAANSGEVYFTDWFGVWYTPNIWEKSTNWHTKVKGHEETAPLLLVAPPAGALVYSGLADVFGFKHEDINDYPSKRLYSLNECFSIGICESYPENIAILGAKTWEGEKTTLAISSDYGESWTERKLPEGSNLGRIAISSLNPDQLVYLTGSGEVYYTMDSGDNWMLSNSAPKNSLKVRNIWNDNNPLAADLVNGDFYLLENGILYSSSDGGMSWKSKNDNPISKIQNNVQLAPVPGRAEEILISMDKNGLWKTKDAGKTFTKIEMFDATSAVTWGAPSPGSDLPTAYCYGLKEKWGIFMSLDLGKSWILLDNPTRKFPSVIHSMAGDRNLFGRIYVGVSGEGVLYGEPQEKQLIK